MNWRKNQDELQPKLRLALRVLQKAHRGQFWRLQGMQKDQVRRVRARVRSSETHEVLLKMQKEGRKMKGKRNEIGGLVIQRKVGQGLMVGPIDLEIIEVSGKYVRLRLVGPKNVAIHRKELMVEKTEKKEVSCELQG